MIILENGKFNFGFVLFTHLKFSLLGNDAQRIFECPTFNSDEFVEGILSLVYWDEKNARLTCNDWCGRPEPSPAPKRWTLLSFRPDPSHFVIWDSSVIRLTYFCGRDPDATTSNLPREDTGKKGTETHRQTVKKLAARFYFFSANFETRVTNLLTCKLISKDNFTRWTEFSFIIRLAYPPLESLTRWRIGRGDASSMKNVVLFILGKYFAGTTRCGNERKWTWMGGFCETVDRFGKVHCVAVARFTAVPIRPHRAGRRRRGRSEKPFFRIKWNTWGITLMPWRYRLI